MRGESKRVLNLTDGLTYPAWSLVSFSCTKLIIRVELTVSCPHQWATELILDLYFRVLQCIRELLKKYKNIRNSTMMELELRVLARDNFQIRLVNARCLKDQTPYSAFSTFHDPCIRPHHDRLQWPSPMRNHPFEVRADTPVSMTVRSAPVLITTAKLCLELSLH